MNITLMQHDISASVERRRLKLLYVTSHMRDLQGIAGMPFIFVLLAYVVWAREYPFRMTHPFRRTQSWFLLAGLLAAFFMSSLIRRWYRDSFGLVHEPEPEIETSPMLSILHAKPAPTPEQRIEARKRMRLRIHLVWIGAGWMVISVLNLIHQHPQNDPCQPQFLFWPLYLLLPRCSWDAPPVFSLQLRRALSFGALAMLIAVVTAASFALITKWALLYFVLSGALIFLSYDHWLLLHLLPASSARRQVSGE